MCSGGIFHQIVSRLTSQPNLSSTVIIFCTPQIEFLKKRRAYIITQLYNVGKSIRTAESEHLAGQGLPEVQCRKRQTHKRGENNVEHCRLARDTVIQFSLRGLTQLHSARLCLTHYNAIYEGICTLFCQSTRGKHHITAARLDFAVCFSNFLSPLISLSRKHLGVSFSTHVRRGFYFVLQPLLKPLVCHDTAEVVQLSHDLIFVSMDMLLNQIPKRNLAPKDTVDEVQASAFLQAVDWETGEPGWPGPKPLTDR